MEGYKKYTMRDHLGNVVFPETHAEMVRESPDRRFVDNVEKQTLSKFGGQLDTVDLVLQNSESIAALIAEEPSLARLLDSVPTNLADSLLVVEQLNKMTPYIDQILESISKPPVAYSITTSGTAYTLKVDDSDPGNPKVIAEIVDNRGNQPINYSIGDIWKVADNAPDVLITLKPDLIAFDNSRKTVLLFNEGKVLAPIGGEQEKNILNGVQQEKVEATNDNIPQAFIMYNVNEQLKQLFGKGEMQRTISAFTIETLAQPTNEVGAALTQAYMNGNVVQPIREAQRESDYVRSTFQNITWTNSLDTNFIKEWLNNEGIAAMVTYGKPNGGVSISRPFLNIYIENPYKGKTLVAQNEMGAEFSILDWVVQE